MSRRVETSHQTLSILRCKVVLVGDATCGKTALSRVFQSDGADYPKDYLLTVGAELFVKQVPIPETPYIVELFIYDTSGQSIFNQLDLNSAYYTDAAAVMVNYNIGSRESLQATPKWLNSVKTALTNNTLPIGVLVGNKLDLRDDTYTSRGEVSESDGRAMAESLGLQFFETSAMMNKGVDEPFKYIAEMFVKKYEESGQTVEDFNKHFN